MNRKNDIEVIINNKRYVLCGYESDEYLQKVAAYINNKIVDLKHQDFYRIMDSDMRNVVLQINLADDYFKIKRQVEEIESEGDTKSNEIYSLKHEIISLQSKLDTANAEIEKLKKESIEEQKKIVKLETELSESRKKSK